MRRKLLLSTRDIWRRPLGLFVAAWLVMALGAMWGTSRVLDAQARQEVASAEAAGWNGLDAVTESVQRLVDAVTMLHRLARIRVEGPHPADHEAVHAVFDAAIEDTIREFVLENRFGIVQVSVIDADGRLAWSTRPGWQPIDLSDREYFRVHAVDGHADLFIGAPVRGRASNRWVVQFTRPLRLPDGGFGGIAVASVDPDWLSSRLAAYLDNQSDAMAIIRNSGAVVIARQPWQEEVSDRQAPFLPGSVVEDLARGHVVPRTVFVSPVTQGRMLLLQRSVAGTPLVAAHVIDLDALNAQGLGRRIAAWIIVSLGLLLVLVGGFALTYRAARDTERRRKALIDDTIDGLPLAVYRARLSAAGERRIVYASPNLPEIAGLPSSPGEDRAEDWHARLDPCNGERPSAFLQRLLADGSGTVEYSIRDAAGQLRLLQETARVRRRVPDGGADVFGYVADVTRVRALERQAADATHLAGLGELAAEVAHEMNQPLNTALLAAENAEYDLDENNVPRLRTRLRRIVESLERTARITEHLRRLARGDTSRDLVPVSVPEIVDGTLLVAGGTMRQARIALRRDLPEDLPPVLAQPLLFEQVLVNLLLNARDAFAAKALSGRSVTISARAVGDMVEIRVTDTAGGMPPEVLARIFEPFFSTKPPGKGTGLGLPIARQSISSMGGTLVASPDAAGMTFVIQLRAIRPGSGVPQDVLCEKAGGAGE